MYVDEIDTFNTLFVLLYDIVEVAWSTYQLYRLSDRDSSLPVVVEHPCDHLLGWHSILSTDRQQSKMADLFIELDFSPLDGLLHDGCHLYIVS